MYVVRENFTARPGQASALTRWLEQVVSDAGVEPRVPDFVAEFNTVILETEVDDFATFERMMGDVTGRREVYRVL